MRPHRLRSSNSSFLRCAGLAGIIAAILTIVAKCFEYSLFRLFGKDVPWYWDLAGGLVLNAVNIPLAVILKILELCGVAPTPIFG